ncbi:hypothetical protein [Methanolapillus ohkumae]|uniref:Lipoprotein n=1 Tax=Methanolapillus ohkumae TaxID=3028298 RepID=A0AA96ZVY8_9EURY|nr:hypothetical protein MsAm2_12050 [Methanosarcinaceae archaeon Am2]
MKNKFLISAAFLLLMVLVLAFAGCLGSDDNATDANNTTVNNTTNGTNNTTNGTNNTTNGTNNTTNGTNNTTNGTNNTTNTVSTDNATYQAAKVDSVMIHLNSREIVATANITLTSGCQFVDKENATLTGNVSTDKTATGYVQLKTEGGVCTQELRPGFQDFNLGNIDQMEDGNYSVIINGVEAKFSISTDANRMKGILQTQ